MPIVGGTHSSRRVVPNAPTVGTATDSGAVGANGRAFNNGSVSVTFTAPSYDGGLPITGYTAIASTGPTQGGASSPISVTGLGSSTTPSFTVTATNAVGTSTPSGATAQVPVTTVPQAPTIGSASAGNASATVSYTANASGGKTVTQFTATSSPGGVTGTGPSAITVSPLTNGQPYTFTVTATNGNGNSLASGPSNQVTPLAPPPPIIATPPPIIAVTPPIIAVTPPIIAVTPPIIAVTPPIIAVTPPIIAVTPPIIAVTPPPPLFCDPQFGFCYSIGSNTRVLTLSGYKLASDLVVGDELMSLDISEITSDGSTFDVTNWSSPTFSESGVRTTFITAIREYVAKQHVQINGDWFSDNHFVLVRKDGVYQFLEALYVDATYEIYNYQMMDWVPVTSVEVLVKDMLVYSIDCEPYDIFFTENMLVYNIKEYRP